MPGRLGGYRLDTLLGRGGMGEVFLAWDERLRRRVALKRVLTEPPPTERARARFRREARATARLSHPSIVQVFELLEAEDGDVLVMEYVEGRGLGELIAAGELDLETVLRLGTEIADGLAEAHGKGLVHRDLKPDNVRVTPSGHAKVLDFGLARLLWSDAQDAASLVATLTRSGALIGTVHAMSPEQVSGRRVDHRSDLFSLGSLLYEMLTGRPPFRGENLADSLLRVHRAAPTPLAELRPGLPPELGRLVESLLARSPDERPRNARQVADALERLRAASVADAVDERPPDPSRKGSGPAPETLAGGVEGLATGEMPRPEELAPDSAGPDSAGPDSAGRSKLWRAAFVALALLGSAVPWWIWRQGHPGAAPGSTDPSSIAVLYFQNLTGETGLDWMRQGIAESLMTALAGSPEIDVLSGGKLHDVLADLDALEAPPSFELIRQVAARGPAGAVIRGSFTRVGVQLSINVSLETARGEILTSAQARDHQDRFFLLVDEIGAAVRSHFETEPPGAAPESIAMVTTHSLEAWRYYTEGMGLLRAAKMEEAEVLLLEAVEVDPEFALAFADLGPLQRNLGKTADAFASTRRAVELADRLPRPRRHELEGSHYESRWSTYRQAIEAFRAGMEFEPGRRVFREHLGHLYACLERYEEAIEAFGTLAGTGSVSVYSAYNAAFSYAALDQLAAGEQVLTDQVRRQGSDWLLEVYLGSYALHRGDLDAAEAALAKAQRLRPGAAFVHYALRRLAILREDWQRADSETEAITSGTDPYSRWLGAFSASRNLLYQGRSEDALARLADAAQAYPEPNPANAQARCWRAELLLARGEAELALAEALRAREEGEGYWPEIRGTFLAALAEETLGHTARADALAAFLDQHRRGFPNPVEQRQALHLEGRRALLRGDAGAAVEALRRAQALLPPRGVEMHEYILPDHVPVWTALGEAELLAGNAREAVEWLGKATRSGTERIERPVPWISAFFFLGRAHRKLGEETEARRAFDRFLGFWLDADLKNAWIDEAR